MIDEKLSGSYEGIKKKYESILEDIERGELVKKYGRNITIISFFFMLLLLGVFKIDFEPLNQVILLGLLFGIIIFIIGAIIRNNEIKTDFLIEEACFLYICESLKDIESFQKYHLEQDINNAVKKLIEFEKQIYEPTWNGGLWEKLAEEENKNLNILKKNINERLIPSIKSITKDNEEEVNKVYSNLEKLAQYLLSPTISELINLNNSMLELKFDPKIKPRHRRNYFHPYMVHTYVFVIICAISYIAYHLGIYINASIDTAYLGTIGLFGALLAGYMIFMIKK